MKIGAFSRCILSASLLFACHPLVAQAPGTANTVFLEPKRPSIAFSEYGEGTRRIPAFCASRDTLWKHPHAVLRMLPSKHRVETAEPEVTLHDIGEVAFHQIVELQYRERSPDVPGFTTLTHILFAGTEFQGYCAVLAHQYGTSEAWIIDNRNAASKIVTLAAEPILQFRLLLGGSGHGVAEHYFFFDNGRPEPVEFFPPGENPRSSLVPPGSSNWKGGAFCLEDLQWRSGLWRKGDSNCCPSAGILFVQFRLNGRKLERMEEALYRDWSAMEEAKGRSACR